MAIAFRTVACFFAVLGAGALPARPQIRVDRNAVADAERAFALAPAANSLKCDFHPLAPSLGYGLRFEADYELRFPFSQLVGADHSLTILTRLTGREGGHDPMYFADHVVLPPIPETKQEGELRQRFAPGSGKYAVEVLAIDDSRRVCRGAWTMTVKRAPDPNMGGLPDRPERVSIFLDATPMQTRSAAMTDADVSRLTDSLEALSRYIPARKLRLVVFSLDLRREFYRSDDFTGAQLPRVRRILRTTMPGTIDVQTLAGPGPVAFLSDLIRRETSESQPSRAVIFLGAAARAQDTFPRSRTGTSSRTDPSFFYVQFRRIGPSLRGGTLFDPDPDPTTATAGPIGSNDGRTLSDRTQMPGSKNGPTLTALPARDTIDSAIAALRGRVMQVDTPLTFAQALRRIASAVSRAQ